MLAFGWRVFGAGIAAIGLVNLLLGDFDPAQPVPKFVPDRIVLAYVAALFLLVTGLALQWRRTIARAAAVLTCYYTLVVLLLLNGRVIINHYAEFGAYSGAAEDLAITAASLIVFSAHANLERATSARLTRVGRQAFGLSAIVFGGAHFFYLDLTTPLVPKWLPASPVFWAYATGAFHIMGGIAILAGIRARLAAILLTVMYASFTPLVHIPTLFSDPFKPFYWTENVLNLTLVGAAWVVADSWRTMQSSGKH